MARLGHNQKVLLSDFERELVQMTEDELDEFASDAARAVAYFEALEETAAAEGPQPDRRVPDPTKPVAA